MLLYNVKMQVLLVKLIWQIY